MTHKEIMQLGIERAKKTMKEHIGGPFGAVITRGKEIIAVASNTVLKDNDPTCHAEINAIKEACKNLKTYNLIGCEIYATGYPCPMCMSAIIWANIKKVYVSGLPSDAEEIGFRDDFIYRFIEDDCKDKDVVDIERLDSAPAVDLYKEYSDTNKTIY